MLLKRIGSEMALESPDWEQILETLPVGESEDLEDKRRCFFSQIFFRTKR